MGPNDGWRADLQLMSWLPNSLPLIDSCTRHFMKEALLERANALEQLASAVLELVDVHPEGASCVFPC